jgi:uncharacterized protein YabN with tetrapyrrole methylase and pyrophosphatase domain
LKNWEAIKSEEKRTAKKGETETPDRSILDGVSSKAPALMEAHQISTKVPPAWDLTGPALTKSLRSSRRKSDELRVAIEQHKQSADEADHVRVREEIGDMLFVVTNIARHLSVEPEAALKLANRKFRKRFCTY